MKVEKSQFDKLALLYPLRSYLNIVKFKIFKLNHYHKTLENEYGLKALTSKMLTISSYTYELICSVSIIIDS